MVEMIEEAKKAMARENNFTFLGEAADNEAGHVANMANQVIFLLLIISYYPVHYTLLYPDVVKDEAEL